MCVGGLCLRINRLTYTLKHLPLCSRVQEFIDKLFNCFNNNNSEFCLLKSCCMEAHCHVEL